MITSFTARYLVKGAEFLKESEPLESSVPHQLGRGLYSLGVIVAAPCGILYHSIQGTRFRIQAAFTSNDQEVKQLKERSVQHLNAALYDLKGFATVITSVLVAVAVFVLVYSAFHKDWITFVGLSGPLAVGYWASLAKDLLVFNFVQHPSEYLQFISDRSTDPAVPSDRTRFKIELWIKPLIRKGIFIDERLTDAQVAAIDNVHSQMKRANLIV